MRRLAILTPKYADYSQQTRWSLMRLKHSYPGLMILPMTVAATYIHVARTMLLDAAVQVHTTGEQPLDYILWLDSDVSFIPEDVQHLYYFLQTCTTRSCVSGLYYCRHTVNFPCGWTGSMETGINYINPWEINEHHKVDFAGLGFFLMPIDIAVDYVKANDYRELFRSDNWVPSLNGEGYCQAGEDIYFTDKLGKMGVDIWLDTHVRLNHAGITHEKVMKAREENRVQPYATVVIEEI